MAGFRTNVRKCFEISLRPAVAPTLVILPNLGDDTKGLAEYVRLSFHYGKRIVREIGPNPRIECSGFALVGVFTKLGTAADRNDTLAGIVEATYPYDLNLTFGGLTVNISTVEPGDGMPTPTGWYYTPVQVNWNIWRL